VINLELRMFPNGTATLYRNLSGIVLDFIHIQPRCGTCEARFAFVHFDIGCNSDLRQYQIPQSHQSEIHLVHGRISALSVFEIAEKRASREYPEL
jgi:hypothetical protein